jgi:anti-anti-sigma factor
VSVSFEDQTTNVTLSGDIDLALATDLDDAAEEVIARGLPVRLDVAAVSFIDSVGLSFLARLVIAGRDAGWRPALLGGQRRFLETVALAGLTSQVDVG